MYGMVNKGIQGLVVSKYGTNRWEKIKIKSGFKDGFFVSMKSYPDDLTYKLVKNTAIELSLSQESVLQAFGEYWILYTAEEGYHDILKIYGSKLPDFLMNLNTLHEQITYVMPNLKPPKFTCIQLEENKYSLTYESERVGLKPMVIGLLIGLGKRFKMKILVIKESEETIEEKTNGIFTLSW